jgi:hypothetical protein
LSGAGFVQKHAGLIGCLFHTLIIMVIFVGLRRFHGYWHPWCARHFKLLSVLFFAGLISVFAVGYPIVNQGGPEKSSDREDGLNIAVTRMIHGENPYYPAFNPHAGPLSVLPGSITLATPFVVIGNSAYQNIFWLGVFLIAAARFFKDRALALALISLPLALSPALQYEFISGGDLISNGIFVTIFSLAALSIWLNPDAPHWLRWLTCLLLALGLASRANFILLTPIFGAIIWRANGPRQALVAMALVGVAVLAFTVPFYLRDPAAFTPLLSRYKLSSINHALPWASHAMLGMTILVSLLLSVRIIMKSQMLPLIDAFFRACAIATLTPILSTILLSSWVNRQLDFGFLSDRFGIMFVFFALMGWGNQGLKPRASQIMYDRA